MGTYGQWARHRRLTRVAWVCGPEAALRYDVAAAWKDGLALPADRRYSVHATGADTALWDYLLTAPASSRLVTVWDAERLSRIDWLSFLLEPEFDGAYAVFVSAAGDFPRAAAGEGARPVLAPGLAALRDSRHAQLIRCCAPSDPEARAGIVGSWWGKDAGRNIGAAVLDRCGGDMGAARDAVLKARCAGLVPSAEDLDLICLPGPAGFADSVIAGSAAAAMAAAAVLAEDEVPAVLGLLSSRLGTLALLGDAVRKGGSVQDAAIRLKIDAWSARLLRPHAAAYTPAKTARCREVLALAESAWKGGARTGVLEAVAALW